MDNELSWGRSLPDDLLARWPKLPDGQPEKPALLCHCRAQDMSDELKVNMLEDAVALSTPVPEEDIPQP